LKKRELDGALQKHHSNTESQTVNSEGLERMKRVQLFEWREVILNWDQVITKPALIYSTSTEYECLWVIWKKWKVYQQDTCW